MFYNQCTVKMTVIAVDLSMLRHTKLGRVYCLSSRCKVSTITDTIGQYGISVYLKCKIN